MTGVIGETFKDKRGTIFHYCTGYEGQDHVCWWCGKPFESKRPRHCCCADHTEQYDRHFSWPSAVQWALKRTDHKCQECGRAEGYSGGRPWNWNTKSDLEVHHIIPLNGCNRAYNVLNCPCNLLVLCLECHGKTRGKEAKLAVRGIRQLNMKLGT